MISIGLSIIILILTLSIQPLAREWALYANFVPVLITFWARRLADDDLMILCVTGGIVMDAMTNDAFGFGPLLLGILIFVARTQRIWINLYGWWFGSFVTFAISWMYFILSRLTFLLERHAWSWGEELLLQVFLASLLNAAVYPLANVLLRVIYVFAKKQTQEKGF